MNWKLVLGILTANVLFMSSSYTMLIPFLPMYLTLELGVPESDVNIWSGIVFSASFVMSAVMAPIWGKLADKKGKRLMAIRASFLLSISYFLGGIVQTPEQLALMRLFQGFAAGLWPMELAIMSL
jgi:DHA1 family multidrug resistance protein-like MFS transporter